MYICLSVRGYLYIQFLGDVRIVIRLRLGFALVMLCIKESDLIFNKLLSNALKSVNCILFACDDCDYVILMLRIGS